jgi:hypothetical protein
MRPDLSNLIEAGNEVQKAVKKLEQEILKTYQGLTVYVPKNTIPYYNEEAGPCLVDSIALFGTDDTSETFSWKHLWVQFHPPDEKDTDDIVYVELQYLDRLKIMI